ncbi:protein phosphatase [Cyclospora cayetanensis]|uniref:Protein phosphatase n=1 Tax=Cyclospora cayetanensis TaxID=88456 RepID=A0A1D3D4V1_9EIME|nr:protein phosphatase [Cyclospora cayetanensis]
MAARVARRGLLSFSLDEEEQEEEHPDHPQREENHHQNHPNQHDQQHNQHNQNQQHDYNHQQHNYNHQQHDYNHQQHLDDQEHSKQQRRRQREGCHRRSYSNDGKHKSHAHPNRNSNSGGSSGNSSDASVLLPVSPSKRIVTPCEASSNSGAAVGLLKMGDMTAARFRQEETAEAVRRKQERLTAALHALSAGSLSPQGFSRGFVDDAAPSRLTAPPPTSRRRAAAQTAARSCCPFVLSCGSFSSIGKRQQMEDSSVSVIDFSPNEALFGGKSSLPDAASSLEFSAAMVQERSHADAFSLAESVSIGTTGLFLAMSRCLGDFSLKRASQQLVPAEAEVTYRHLMAYSDRLLVLATDGLWDVMNAEGKAEASEVDRDEHQQLARQCTGFLENAQLEWMAKELTCEALRRGSEDNITTLLVALNWKSAGNAES